jgi:hypothetical protein
MSAMARRLHALSTRGRPPRRPRTFIPALIVAAVSPVDISLDKQIE